MQRILRVAHRALRIARCALASRVVRAQRVQLHVCRVSAPLIHVSLNSANIVTLPRSRNREMASIRTRSSALAIVHA
eukprot:8186926-Lingulodinium_polyedra.AAC.1